MMPIVIRYRQSAAKCFVLVTQAVAKARSPKAIFDCFWTAEVLLFAVFQGRYICFDMCMLDEIRAKREEIYAIARAHKAEKLWVFGSCARKEEAVAI